MKDCLDAGAARHTQNGLFYTSRYHRNSTLVTGATVSIADWANALKMDHSMFAAALREARFYKDRLVSAKLGLVLSMAKRYQGSEAGLTHIIQEGSLGLILKSLTAERASRLLPTPRW